MKTTTARSNVTRRFAIGAAMLTLACASLMGQPGQARDVDVPPALRVPEGHQAFMKAAAAGTQNYICLASGWNFIGPQATLFQSSPSNHGPMRKQVATHFLSQNPAEGNTARPTWQDSSDSSLVWARPVASSNDPGYVDPTAVPWLLLEATGTLGGPVGAAFFTQTAYIQRVNTSGGMAPATPCTIGERAFVPYTADYIFYRKK